MVGNMQGARRAEDMGAHERRVIMVPGAGEFERELVLRVELAPPRFVAAEQRILAGTDDELVRRIVAACAKDRVVHGGEDVAFLGPAPQMRDRGRVRRVRKARPRAAHGRFRPAISPLAAPDDARSILERGEAVELRLEPPAVAVREALRLVFDADARPERPSSCASAFSSAAGAASFASFQMRMSSMSEVWRAWRKSAERVSSAMRPSAFTTRHWKKQKPKLS